MKHEVNLNKQINALDDAEKERLIKVQHHLLKKLLVSPNTLTFLEIAGLKETFGQDIILPIERKVSDNRGILLTMIEDYDFDYLKVPN